MPGEIAFLWHLHQPPYEDPETRTFLLPWVRLHATRGYLDLAAMHRRYPEVRATVNFSPILLEQLEAYAEGRARDRFLDLAARPPADLGEAERAFVVRHFFAVSYEQGIEPLPRYRALFELRGRGEDPARAARRFRDEDVRDLQVLFQLAWMGFFARKESEVVRELLRKGAGYTEEEKHALLAEQARLVGLVLPMWKEVAAGGSVELSASPYAHPILPLLCDTDVAAVALPDAHLPRRLRARDEAERQVRRGLEVHARVFGERPLGMWPSEGSVSDEALEVLWEQGVRWAATDEEILLRSVPPPADPAAIYRPWKVRAGAGEIHLLFRDRRLSDRIGFTYARAAPHDAVDDLFGEVSRIDSGFRGHRALVPIILDGENPWEYYPGSGEGFLEELFGRLARREEGIGTVTVADTMAWDGPVGRLGRIHPGSWIEANFRIWIGHIEDVRAWNLVGEAKAAVDRATGRGDREAVEAARPFLLRAEASDWFWWYGEDFATETRTDFDLLFRNHVQAVFRALGEEPPEASLRPIVPEGRGFGEALVAKAPTGFVRPRIDGVLPSYWEWLGAGLYVPGHGQAMYRGAGPFARMYYGFDPHRLFLRLDPVRPLTAPPFDALAVEIRGAKASCEIEGTVRGGEIDLRLDGRTVGAGRFERILEMALEFERLDLGEGDHFGFAVRLFHDRTELQRMPEDGFVPVEVPGPHFEETLWKV
ncbi:MAG TPA: glycoside hydrolase family 57 protein [Fredinandcohnia sp.]|nr:glycoside hydrolase family 57 protein [Fredinandcohnia sp.]